MQKKDLKAVLEQQDDQIPDDVTYILAPTIVDPLKEAVEKGDAKALRVRFPPRHFKFFDEFVSLRF